MVMPNTQLIYEIIIFLSARCSSARLSLYSSCLLAVMKLEKLLMLYGSATSFFQVSCTLDYIHLWNFGMWVLQGGY